MTASNASRWMCARPFTHHLSFNPRSDLAQKVFPSPVRMGEHERLRCVAASSRPTRPSPPVCSARCPPGFWQPWEGPSLE